MGTEQDGTNQPGEVAPAHPNAVAAAPTNLCVVCCNPIPLGAKKCTECDSFQDGRRFIMDWTAVIAALLTVAPLCVGAFSLYEIAFPDPAAVSVMVESCSTSEISAYVLNQGGESALVSPPTVILTNGAGTTPLQMTFPLTEDNKVIEGGEVDVVPLMPPEGAQFPQKQKSEDLCEMEVIFSIKPLEGKAFPKSEKCACPA